MVSRRVGSSSARDRYMISHLNSAIASCSVAPGISGGFVFHSRTGRKPYCRWMGLNDTARSRRGTAAASAGSASATMRKGAPFLCFTSSGSARRVSSSFPARMPRQSGRVGGRNAAPDTAGRPDISGPFPAPVTGQCPRFPAPPERPHPAGNGGRSHREPCLFRSSSRLAVEIHQQAALPVSTDGKVQAVQPGKTCGIVPAQAQSRRQQANDTAFGGFPVRFAGLKFGIRTPRLVLSLSSPLFSSTLNPVF